MLVRNHLLCKWIWLPEPQKEVQPQKEVCCDVFNVARLCLSSTSEGELEEEESRREGAREWGGGQETGTRGPQISDFLLSDAGDSCAPEGDIVKPLVLTTRSLQPYKWCVTFMQSRGT